MNVESSKRSRTHVMCSRSSRGATCPSRSPRPRLDRKRSSLASAHWRGPDSSHACRATKSSTFRPPRRMRVSVMVQFGYRTSQLPMQTQMRTMWKNRTPRHPIVARTSWTTRKRHIHVHSHRRRRRCTANGVGSFQSSIDNERWIVFLTFQTLFPDDVRFLLQIIPTFRVAILLLMNTTLFFLHQSEQ